MAIIMHPLTAQNGSPEYTADDYRHAINPLLLPSDGTAFNGLSGIRYGSPSPLVTVSGLTATVKAHCGTISPWDGLGAYTYAITTNTTVQLADSTNDYKIAVTVEDPSQSHGTTPRGQLKLFTAGTPDSNINGLVIAEVNAGVPSDKAPIIRSNAILMARDLTQLNTISAMDGQEAVTMADNAHYVRNDGAWKPVFETVHESWQGGTITVIYGESSCAVQVTGVKIGGGSWDSADWGKTIREAYRPKYEMSNPMMVANGASHTGFLIVTADGVVSVKNMGSSGSGDTRNGNVCWPVQRQY
jgi:hypothetical protein